MFRPQDVNELRRLLQMGAIAPEDLASVIPGGENTLAQLLQQDNPQQQMPAPNYDIPPMQQNAMRFESGPDQGRVVPLDFPQQQREPMRVAQMGVDGILSQGGPDVGSSEIDYSSPFEIAGVGKGYRTKDGRAAIIKGQKILLGVDRDAAFKRAKQDFEMKHNNQTLQKGDADLEHQQEQTAALQALRLQREDPTSQGALVKKFGPAPKGFQWTQEGRAVPIAGGDEDTQSISAIEGGQEMMRKIDEMIGKRDASGKLVGDSKPHPGFESAVGLSIPKALGAGFIPGTDTTNFNTRLDEVKGGAFLQAFEKLKGGGQITEVEGKKATDAITRMRTSQSEEEFIKAAQEFQNVVRSATERAQSRRGSPVQQAPVSTSSIPQSAIDYLKQNPNMRTAFDMKYGKGAAASILGK